MSRHVRPHLCAALLVYRVSQLTSKPPRSLCRVRRAHAGRYMHGPQSLAASAVCAAIGVAGVIQARKSLAPAPASPSGVERADTSGLSASACCCATGTAPPPFDPRAAPPLLLTLSASHCRTAFARTALLFHRIACRAAEQRSRTRGSRRALATLALRRAARSPTRRWRTCASSRRATHLRRTSAHSLATNSSAASRTRLRAKISGSTASRPHQRCAMCAFLSSEGLRGRCRCIF